MKDKLSTQSGVDTRNKNYMSWWEFWHPRKAAAMKQEERENDDNRYYNSEQDRLEALMSLRLTEQDRKLKEKQFETTKTIGIAIVFAIVVFVIVKYV